MSLGAHALHGRRALGSRGVRSRSAGVAVTCAARCGALRSAPAHFGGWVCVDAECGSGARGSAAGRALPRAGGAGSGLTQRRTGSRPRTWAPALPSKAEARRAVLMQTECSRHFLLP